MGRNNLFNSNRKSSSSQRAMQQPRLASPEMVFSDDDSLIRDLEDMPNTPTAATTSNTPIGRSPFLSASEELRLLADKRKPNSPDHDNESAAPSPPRSHHKRSFQGKVGRSAAVNNNITSRPSLLDVEEEVEPSITMMVHNTVPTTVTDNPNTTGRSSSTEPVVTTTYMDPTTGEAIHTNHPASQVEGLPGLHLAAISASSSSSEGNMATDSATTTTPVTLTKQLQAEDGELKAYTTSYLPKQLNLVPSSSTAEDSISKANSLVDNDDGSNSYLVDLSLNGLSTASTADDDDDENGVNVLSNSQFAHHHLGYLMDQKGGTAAAAVATTSRGELGNQHRRDEDEEAEARIRSYRSYTKTPDGRTKRLSSSSDRYYDQSGGSRRWKLYGVVFGCLLVLVGVIAGVYVYFAKKATDDGGGVSINSNCQNAQPLYNLTGGTVQGEILSDVKGSLGAECQVEPGDGYTLWYSVKGTNQRLIASTCVGTSMSQEDDDSDTQVLVFAGACGTLQCIGGSDQLCGSHGSVGWFAEQGTRYYIVVKGFETSNQGLFTLTLDTLTENHSCDGAKQIDDSTENPIIGSTRDMTIANSVSTCEEIEVDAPVSWFRVEGDGSVMCASVATEETQKPDFVVGMSVLEGLGCSELSCIGSTSVRDDEPFSVGDIAFVADEGTSYYVAIRGEEDDSQGDFILSLVQTPPNGVCDRAEPLQIGGGRTNGTMVNACNVERSECQGSLNQPGVWYSVEGNGELFIVHVFGLTCHGALGIQSQVSIFKAGEEGCTNLQCVDYKSLECTAGNEKVVSQWFSDPGETYYVFVQSSDDREFVVLIDEFLPEGSDTCLNASSLVFGGDGDLGSTLGANSADLGECSNSGAAGVWYTVEGTGGSMEASTCNQGTNYSTGLTIFTGGCDGLQCVPSKTVTCDGERSMTYWESIPGQEYSVYVHGKESTDEGRFSLTIDEGTLGVDNDFCGSAELLTIPSTAYGSTVNATSDDDYARMCGNVASAPGVWYTVVGEGKFISASLCGDSTSYDTQIYVFIGDSCKDMTCVNFNEDGCGVQSRISWRAQEGQLYYILVSGFSTAVGEFELIVS
jgi:hypothetical protein